MKNLGNLLIIDDNKDVLSALEVLLEDEFEKFTAFNNPNALLRELEQEDYDVILLDMNFSSRIQTGNEGIYWLRKVLEQNPDQVVVMFTAYGDVELAVKAIREGALDFVMKPWDNDKLLATLQAGVKLNKTRKESEKHKLIHGVLQEEINRNSRGLTGRSSAFGRIRELIKKTAPTDATILLTGENGTGKSLLAREIHNESLRKEEVFITVDLGSIHENLFESELFGYKKGAFTDAQNDRKGRIETADGGTLFLDEIGNLSLPMQSKLLSVLQEKMITPLGSNQSKKVDIRLICATNKNLVDEVQKGRFREDLYYRINTIDIEIPPLRERPEDIEELALMFFRQFSGKYQKNTMEMGQDYLEVLKAHHWPGNVRELEHAIEQSVILAENDVLGAGDFYVKHKQLSELDRQGDTLEEIEKQAILRALKNHGGNQVKAAKELNITRQTIYNKMKKYDL